MNVSLYVRIYLVQTTILCKAIKTKSE